MNEATIETAFVRTAKCRGVWALKLNPLGQAGLPDRLCLANHNRVAFVELKAPGKRPRPLQLIIHKRLRRLGFRIEVIDSLEGVQAFFDEWIGERE